MKTKTKYVVFDNKTKKRIKTVTLTHTDNLHYKQIEPFEKDLLQKGLSAQEYNSLNQDYLKGKTFSEKLICLGW